jgi:hypothetical protein
MTLKNAPPKSARWKPPLWLLALDTIGLLMLGLGLLMQLAPDSALAQSLPAGVRLPLLGIGGGFFVLGWVGLAMSMLEHRRG